MIFAPDLRTFPTRQYVISIRPESMELIKDVNQSEGIPSLQNGTMGRNSENKKDKPAY